MAYVRSKNVNGHKYYQLVEGYREDGKVKQKVLLHLGRYDSIEEARAAVEGIAPEDYDKPRREPRIGKYRLRKDACERCGCRLEPLPPYEREIEDDAA